MYRSCSKCGNIHPYNYKCNVGKVYRGGEERKLRNTYAWHSKARQIKEKSNYLCAICKDQGIYTYDNLEVHHISKVKDDPSLLLEDYNLITLCAWHHKLADMGEINKNYLLNLVYDREKQLPPRGRA